MTQEDIETSEKALLLLRKAVRETLERKRRLGQYAVIAVDGKPVRLPPGQATRLVGAGGWRRTLSPASIVVPAARRHS